jgi:2Fe-2S ferredoxin
MPSVTYVRHGGDDITIDVPLGQSVMQAAVEHGIDGIVAECGGSCMCATCHIYVAEDQLALTPPMNPAEDAMLEGTASERRPNSRLSCQLVMTPKMEGLIVKLPETQI